MELLFLDPVFKEAIWGGTRLKSVFGYEIPGETTGECWAVSAHAKGDCKIKNQTYAGETLGSLWKKSPELFGNYPGEQFPLLVKIIDAKKDLSIQVHPDDAYAKVREEGSLGKTECWYILDCDKDARIVIGHHAKDKEEVKKMILGKHWNDFIREIPIKKGDFFQIDPGCVHAIKGGTLILETQQNSDITYRVYDYDRLSDGRPRELHIQESIDTIKAPFAPHDVKPQKTCLDGAIWTHFITCPYYSVDQYDIKGEFNKVWDTPFTNVSVLEGEGSVCGIPLKKGRHFIVPYQFGVCEFAGNLSIICSNPS